MCVCVFFFFFSRDNTKNYPNLMRPLKTLLFLSGSLYSHVSTKTIIRDREGGGAGKNTFLYTNKLRLHTNGSFVKACHPNYFSHVVESTFLSQESNWRIGKKMADLLFLNPDDCVLDFQPLDCGLNHFGSICKPNGGSRGGARVGGGGDGAPPPPRRVF